MQMTVPTKIEEKSLQMQGGSCRKLVYKLNLIMFNILQKYFISRTYKNLHQSKNKISRTGLVRIKMKLIFCWWKQIGTNNAKQWKLPLHINWKSKFNKFVDPLWEITLIS